MVTDFIAHSVLCRAAKHEQGHGICDRRAAHGVARAREVVLEVAAERRVHGSLDLSSRLVGGVGELKHLVASSRSRPLAYASGRFICSKIVCGVQSESKPVRGFALDPSLRMSRVAEMIDARLAPIWPSDDHAVFVAIGKRSKCWDLHRHGEILLQKS